MLGWTYAGTWPGQPMDVRVARGFVAGHLHAHQLAPLVPDACLLVGELAANAVLHARTPFTVTLQRNDRDITVLVGDGSAALPVVHGPGWGDDGGRGLRLVSTLSSSWGITLDSVGGKTVWASLAIRPG